MSRNTGQAIHRFTLPSSSPATSLRLQFGPHKMLGKARMIPVMRSVSAQELFTIIFSPQGKNSCKELIINYCRNQIAMKTIGKKLQGPRHKTTYINTVFAAEGKLDNKHSYLQPRHLQLLEPKEVKAQRTPDRNPCFTLG